MKTKIENNSNPSSKGMVVGAYVHGSTGYILLDNNKVYCLCAETSEEKIALTAFIEQLQVGGYVFVYCSAHQKIIRIYDMVSKRIFNVEAVDNLRADELELCGLLRYKTRELLPVGDQAFMFAISNETETKAFALVLSPQQQADNHRKMVKLQAGDKVSIKVSSSGIPAWIFDHTQDFGIEL